MPEQTFGEVSFQIRRLVVGRSIEELRKLADLIYDEHVAQIAALGRTFKKYDNVTFTAKGQDFTGIVHAVNKKSIKVVTDQGPIYRISPTYLTKVDQGQQDGAQT